MAMPELHALHLNAMRCSANLKNNNNMPKIFNPNTFIKKSESFKSLGNEKNKFYHSTAWRKLRNYKININPMCEIKGCNKIGHTIDHINPILQGGELLSLSNLQTLCKFHNAVKTSKQRFNK